MRQKATRNKYLYNYYCNFALPMFAKPYRIRLKSGEQFILSV